MGPVLTTVAVAGYRSLRDVVLPLGRLTVVTGPNGSGKSNLYRALRLLSTVAGGGLVGAVAREGGLSSLVWAGPESGQGEEGTRRRGPVAVLLGFASDDFGYLVDLGLPQAEQTSFFGRDPEIKREQVFAGAAARPSTLLVDRLRPVVRVRDGAWRTLDQQLAPYESIVTDLADGEAAPELLALRRELSAWRFYDHFRVDRDAPARRPQVGTRTRRLADDGADVAAAWQTIREAGFGRRLDDQVQRAFPGCRVEIGAEDGRFRLLWHQSGLLRPLSAEELSDGTLRYLLLAVALLSPEPPPLIVLNEPESSLHPDLLAPLAELIGAASADAQVVVVTHAEPLASALAKSGAVVHRLEGGSGGTRVAEQGTLDRPSWHWGSR
jgi:predicted ATPase